MSRAKLKDDHRERTKDEHKKEAKSVDRAHILSVLSKCRIHQEADKDFSQKIESCLDELDQIEETSLVLQALMFSDHVSVCLDPNSDDLSRMANSSDTLGWYSYQEGELLTGAAALMTYRKKYFLGVFAHELTHWCMQTVFKNECLPYFQTDPNSVRKGEFGEIVHDVADLLNSKITLDPVITSVFKDYQETNWHQELIVRVPHLIAQHGVQNATKIFSRHPPTRALLRFYREHVMAELRRFIANGVLEKSRETVGKLNEKLGFLQMYQKYKFRFKSRADVDLQENTSLWVYSSPHPYLSSLKVAWTLNCDETTDLFYRNNVFCDFDVFAENFDDVSSKFMALDECKTLFIVCPEIESDASFKDLFRHLEGTFTIKSHKQVILVVKNKMKKQLKGILNHKFISMKKIEFTDLTEESQELVLKSPITVQGRRAQLNDLLLEEEYHLCDGNLIERLLRSQKSLDKVIVGDGNISQRDCPASFVAFYENLKIQKLIDLVNDCTKSAVEGKPGRFALILVGHIDNYPDKLEEILCEVLGRDDLNEVSISSADALLERDVEHQPVYPILLFDAEGELEYTRLVSSFQDSCGFEVCYFVKVVSKKVTYSDLMFYPNLMFHRELKEVKAKDGDENINLDTFMKNIVFGSERVFVISDSAGVGKSKFLNLIYDTTTNYWVTKCSLKSCIPFIDEHTLAAGMDHEDAMAFITKIGRIDDSFAEDLLNLKMTQESRFPAILLLDGMDEITSSRRNSASKNKEKIANLIEFLKNFTFLRVVVTTRPESESELTHLSCPVYEFTAISLEESLEYVTKLCIARNQLFQKSMISMGKVKSLVQKYVGGYQIDNHVSQDFLTTPLHVSMLSEIIVESMKDDTFNCNIFDSNGNLMPDKLYSEFINIKYRIYFEERKNNTAEDERLKHDCNSAFESLAFFYLYGHESIDSEYFKKNYLFHNESGKLSLKYDLVALYFDIGIISAAPEGNVDFVHQTFAEYFVSRLFMSWAQDESMCENWIVDVIYQPHRTLSFLESMLKDTTFSDDLTKYHGNIMSNLDINETTLTIKYHMWFDRLNILKYIFKCWKYINKFRVILDPDTYEKKPTYYPLYFAATMATDRILEYVLQEGFDINYRTPNAYVVSYLFKRCDQALLREFWENGQLKSDVMKNVGNLIVYEAAANGNVCLMEWLETLGYDVHDTKAVDYAIANGKLEMGQWLKNRGVNIHHLSDNFESTLMHTAVLSRQFHVIKWLIGEGLNINAGDRSGRTPLHYAIEFGRLDMVQFLVENGAKVETLSKRGWNALHIAASSRLTRIEMFKWLVNHGSRVDEKTISGSLAVHLALKYALNTEVIEWLLDQTEDLQATGAKGWGCAHYAAANDKRFPLSSVVSRNYNVHVRDKMGKTAAHLALDTMKSLEPYDYASDYALEEYITHMVGPFKSLVMKMMETNESVLEELVSYAKEEAKTKSSSILEMAIQWMETEK